MLVYAIISITSALVFYTIGVWSEKIQGTLKNWHIATFWVGLLFDTIGTTLMGKIAASGIQLNFHAVTGSLAIVLMLFHAVWATVVSVKDNSNAKSEFHKLSIIVWLIWLIPFITGMFLGMMAG